MDQKLLEKLANSSIRTPKFTLRGTIMRGKCVKCYDGDSIHVNVVLNNVIQRFVCRLNGIDTAEITSENEDEVRHGFLARDFVSSKILDKLIYIKCGSFDKYGRLLVDVFYRDNMEGKSLNDELVDERLAYCYGGGKKISFAEWFLKKNA